MTRMIVRITPGVCVLAGVLAITACSGGTGSSRAAAEFDPNAYRAEIEAVEAILYQGSPPDYSDQTRAAAALGNLFDAIAKNEPNRLKRQRAQTLMFLSSRADISDVGYAAPDLGETRAAWEKTRLELFGEAGWFRESTPGLAGSQTRTVAPPTAGEIYELTRMIDRLDDLISDGRPTCDDLGEPAYEPGYESAEGRAQIARWRKFTVDWNERLAYAVAFMPAAPPFDGNTEFVLAHQSVSSAINELRLVPTGAGDWATPFAYQWEQHFDSAERYLSDARERLDALK